MSEILTQTGADLQIRFDPLSRKYKARIYDQTREFDTIEKAVEWCCAVRDRGGRRDGT